MLEDEVRQPTTDPERNLLEVAYLMGLVAGRFGIMDFLGVTGHDGTDATAYLMKLINNMADLNEYPPIIRSHLLITAAKIVRVSDCSHCVGIASAFLERTGGKPLHVLQEEARRVLEQRRERSAAAHNN